LPVMHIQPEPGFRARAAHVATPVRVEVMRDGKSEEAISFINAGTGAHATYQHPEDSAPVSPPPPPPGPPPPTLPPMPDTTESPVSSAKSASSASLAEAIENGPAPSQAKADSGRISIDHDAPKPGEAGYVPAPKTYVVP